MNTRIDTLPKQQSFADVDASFPRLAEADILLDADSPLQVRCLSCGGDVRASYSVDNPSWPEIETVLRELEGRGVASLEMQEEYPYLMVIGTQDKYLVAASTWGSYRFLCSPALWDRAQFMVGLGGQTTGPYPGDLGVETERMLRAARYFARFGTFHPALRWVEEF